ncbi:MAG: hypothetical protein K5917_00045 [Clostridiales bacterium]|nr:hypothetical protein [Clostridiales bacterium]
MNIENLSKLGSFNAVELYNTVNSLADKEDKLQGNTSDKIEISQDYKAFKNGEDVEENIKKKDRNQEKFEKFVSDHKMLMEELEKSKDSSKKGAEETEKLVKCLTIARNILSGKIVSQRDKQYLLKYNSEMYFKAEMMKKQTVNPKKAERVTDDDDKEKMESESLEEMKSASGANEIESKVDSAILNLGQ